MAESREPSADPAVSEDRALRLGRAWYAEIREKHRDEDPKRRKRGDAGDSGDGSWLDRLFDSGGGGSCDGGGDGGD